MAYGVHLNADETMASMLERIRLARERRRGNRRIGRNDGSPRGGHPPPQLCTASPLAQGLKHTVEERNPLTASGTRQTST